MGPIHGRELQISSIPTRARKYEGRRDSVQFRARIRSMNCRGRDMCKFVAECHFAWKALCGDFSFAGRQIAAGAVRLGLRNRCKDDLAMSQRL
jgi:hypothetical protein